METPQSLTLQINHVKAEIQAILSDEQAQGCPSKERLKQEKMTQLETLSSEYRKVARQNDSLDYKRAMKTRNVTAEDLERIKMKRQHAEEEYRRYQLVEGTYAERDPEDVPAFAFLHRDVVRKYGMCPYVNINNTADTKEQLREKRKEWLQTQEDGGTVYYDVVDNLVNCTSLQDKKNRRDALEKSIGERITLVLTPSQRHLYEEAETTLSQYCAAPSKTKRIKDAFKLALRHLSTLHNETSLPLDKFFTTKFAVDIVANQFPCGTPGIPAAMVHDIEQSIDEYVRIHGELKRSSKSIERQRQNLKQELLQGIASGRGVGLPDQLVHDDMNMNVTPQTGRYNTKWSSLTDEQKAERIHSFCEYYVVRYLVSPQLVSGTLKDDHVQDMISTVQQGIACKSITYRHLKWDAKKGIIQSIGNIRYNLETGKFTSTAAPDKPASVSKSKPKSGRKPSERGICTQQNEKVVNEEILQYIVKRMVSEDVSSKEACLDCIERIKSKLKIKKLSSTDTAFLASKYNDMYAIIASNQTPMNPTVSSSLSR